MLAHRARGVAHGVIAVKFYYTAAQLKALHAGGGMGGASQLEDAWCTMVLTHGIHSLPI